MLKHAKNSVNFITFFSREKHQNVSLTLILYGFDKNLTIKSNFLYFTIITFKKELFKSHTKLSIKVRLNLTDSSHLLFNHNVFIRRILLLSSRHLF